MPSRLSAALQSSKTLCVFNFGQVSYEFRIGIDWIGLGWSGLDWNGMEWNGMEWVGLGWVGLGWIGMERNGLAIIIIIS